MTKYIVSFLFLLLAFFSNAQENLILNPSFEDMNWCWRPVGDDNRYLHFCDDDLYFRKEPSKRYPTLREFSNNSYSVPTNSFVKFLFYWPIARPGTGSLTGIWFDQSSSYYSGYAYNFTAADKNAFAWMRLYNGAKDTITSKRSYLQGSLKSELKSGCTYRFQCKLRTLPKNTYGSATSSIGVAFSTESIFIENISEFLSKIRPSIENPEDVFFDQDQYMEFTGNYVAKGGETKFIIGNFKSQKDTKLRPFYPLQGADTNYYAEYHLDDLWIVAVPPAHLILSLGNDTILCDHEQSLIIEAQKGFNKYLWNTGDTSRSIVVSNAGTYIVTAFYDCGYLSDTIIVGQYPRKRNQLGIGDLLEKCPTDEIKISAVTGLSSYRWNNGINSPDLATKQPGIYILSALSKEGCLLKDTVEIKDLTKKAFVSLGNDTSLCKGERIDLKVNVDQSFTILWSTQQTKSSINVEKSGTYWVQVYNKCYHISDTVEVQIRDCSELFIPNVFSPNADGINDDFRVTSLDNRNVELKIYNRWGEQLYHNNNYTYGWKAEQLPDGIYFYQIKDKVYEKEYKGWIQVLR